MADYVRVPETDWQNILDAVRGKTGGADKMLSGVVAEAISSIVSGGGGGLADSMLTVETVITTERITFGNNVYNYIAPLFKIADTDTDFSLQALIVKDVETAKQTDNCFIGAYLLSWGKPPTEPPQLMLRWRQGGYSNAQNRPDFDLILDSGTELYFITLDIMGVLQ